jgi:hypothetical protein
MTSNEWRLVRERTTNVVNHVARAATAKTMMYSRNRIKEERSQRWYRASAARCLAQG